REETLENGVRTIGGGLSFLFPPTILGVLFMDAGKAAEGKLAPKELPARSVAEAWTFRTTRLATSANNLRVTPRMTSTSWGPHPPKAVGEILLGPFDGSRDPLEELLVNP